MNQQQQQETDRIMIDLETMSTAPNAAIVAVGAVRFGRDGLGETFYRRIDLASAMAAGLVADAETIRWWMRQSDAARDEVARLPGGDLGEVLYELKQWIRRDDKPEIWGNGAASDPVWMASAYRACGFEVPWAHWQVRCYRTLRALLPWVPVPTKPQTPHHALQDAVHQAHHAVALLRELERLRPPAVEWVWQEGHPDAPCRICGDTGTAAEPDGAGGWLPVACGCWLGRCRTAAMDAIMRVPIFPGGSPTMAAPDAEAVSNNYAEAAVAPLSAETGRGMNGSPSALCAAAPGNAVIARGVSSLPQEFFQHRRDAE